MAHRILGVMALAAVQAVSYIAEGCLTIYDAKFMVDLQQHVATESALSGPALSYNELLRAVSGDLAPPPASESVDLLQLENGPPTANDLDEIPNIHIPFLCTAIQDFAGHGAFNETDIKKRQLLNVFMTKTGMHIFPPVTGDTCTDCI